MGNKCGIHYPAMATLYRHSALKEELKQWRNAFSMLDAQVAARTGGEKYTVIELATGGCCSVLSSIRAGFHHLFGTEIDDRKRSKFMELTGVECGIDTFDVDFREMKRRHKHANLLKSGMPCQDYSTSGNGKGASGETGWQYCLQIPYILEYEPDIVCLEQVDGILRPQFREELTEVLTQLATTYVVDMRVLEVWRFGDNSNRKRLIIVGCHKRFGNLAKEYEWPIPTFSESTRAPQAWHCAVKDSQVPTEYWRYDEPPMHDWSDPLPGRLHQIARRAPGIGNAQCPNAVYSFFGPFATQLTSNGGSRYPSREWRPGLPLGPTRLTVPYETVAIASLPDDYPEFMGVTQGCPQDEAFLRSSVNQGWPLRMASALDESFIRFLDKVKAPKRVIEHNTHRCSMALQRGVSWAHPDPYTMTINPSEKYTNMMLVDTGAQTSLMHPSSEAYMTNKEHSNVTIVCANKNRTKALMEGVMHIVALDRKGSKIAAKLSFPAITLQPLAKELLSLDDLIEKHGFGLRLNPSNSGKECMLYRPRSKDAPSVRIPIEYDHMQGGWWIMYVPDRYRKRLKREHGVLIAAATNDRKHRTTRAMVGWLPDYDPQGHTEMVQRITNDDDSAIESVLMQHPDERNIRGVKPGLTREYKNMSHKELHEIFGHTSSLSGCEICRMTKGSARRIVRTLDPHQEKRVAHTFVCDTITVNMRSSFGCRYILVLKDVASSFYRLIPLYLRDDSVVELEDFILECRASPYFHGLPYPPISVLKTDQAGEWDHDNVAFQQMVKRRGVIVKYAPKDRHERSAAHAERACGIVEVTMKSLMMQSNCPSSMWQDALSQTEFLLNRLPPVSHRNNMSDDGDQERPLEKLTRGKVSRRTIDKQLSSFLPVGTPALVHRHPPERGSSISSKTRWGIAVSMLDNQVEFMCPFTHYRFHSVSWTAFRLKDGLNYIQWLNLPTEETARGVAALPTDVNDRVDIILPEAVERARRHRPPVELVIESEQGGVRQMQPAQAGVLQQPGPPIVTSLSQQGDVLKPEMRTQELVPSGAKSDLPQAAISQILWQPQPDDPAGGSVNDLEPVEMHGDPAPAKSNALTLPPTGEPSSSTAERQQLALPRGDDDTCWIEIDKIDLEDLSVAAAPDQRGPLHTIKKKNTTFNKLCKVYKLESHQHVVYRNFLRDVHGFPEKTMRYQVKAPKGYLPRGLRLPSPQGKRWKEYLTRCEEERKQPRKRKATAPADNDESQSPLGERGGHKRRRPRSCDEDNIYARAVYVAYEWVKLSYPTQLEASQHHEEVDVNVARRAAKRPKKRLKAVATKGEPPPNTVFQALNHPTRGWQWLESILDEWQGLAQSGCIDHNYTLAQCKELGIESSPVPLTTCLDHRYDGDGNLSKLKTRIAVRGTPRYMQKGVHYNETYAPTPNMNTTRMLMALVVKENLSQKCWDVVKAYTWRKMKDSELLILKYPTGFERYDPQTGEPLFMIMRRNLYGAPHAAKLYIDHRDEFIMKAYNRDGWTCKKSTADPCLFIITRDGKRTWMVCYVDDIDCASECNEHLDMIYKVMHTEWPCKEVASNFMLGVKRTLNTDDKGVRTMDLTMEAYVEGVHNAFKEHTPKVVDSPAEPGMLLSLEQDGVTEAEIKRVLDRGYQSAVGCCLWAARGVFPETLYAVGQCCKLMSKPSEKAWKVIMRVITWMYQRRKSGIRFRSDGNDVPFLMSDATNVGDPRDSKRAYGYAVMWMGGPIAAAAKKLEHSSSATAANEYMALSHATKQAVWIRNVLKDMGLLELIKQPTVIFADNKTANSWTCSDKVTAGNMWILQSYHYVKEMAEGGEKLITVKYVRSCYNLADLFTKAVSREVLQKLMGYLCGLITLTSLLKDMIKDQGGQS